MICDDPEDQPQYPHDCERCVFLGTFWDADLYYCPGGTWGAGETIIARYGVLGDYSSGFEFADRNPHLAEARRRVAARNLRTQP